MYFFVYTYIYFVALFARFFPVAPRSASRAAIRPRDYLMRSNAVVDRRRFSGHDHIAILSMRIEQQLRNPPLSLAPARFICMPAFCQISA